jgi:protein tyrosine/serine phosphatase
VSDRAIVLPGLLNLRDLGGLPTVDGGQVRRGLLFRSDYPALLGPGQVAAALTKLGLRTVVDLRARREAEHECVDWREHGVDYHRYPVSSGASSWDAGYRRYLTHRPETVVQAVRVLLDPDVWPVLFHCAAGKDRTGTVAALVLCAMGVEASDIVADYVLSEASVEGVLARLAGAAPYLQVLAGETAETQRPRATAMSDFLEWLEGQGGARRWLDEQGIGADLIERARDSLVTGP